MEILPCPLCGGTAPLLPPKKRRGSRGYVYAGPESASSSGVSCFRCGLKVVVEHPDRWPKDTPKSLTGWAAIDWLHRRCLEIAIGRWNRLLRKGSSSPDGV